MSEWPSEDQPRHPESGEPLETTVLNAQEKDARRRRNMAIGIALCAFAVLVFAVTVIRLSSNISGG